MRKYKQVKRKEVIFDLKEWTFIESNATKISMTTSDYIRRMALNGNIIQIEMTSVTPVINALRIIGGNINQLAKKANEINSIYVEDIEKLREENQQLCHTLSQYLSEIQSHAA